MRISDEMLNNVRSLSKRQTLKKTRDTFTSLIILHVFLQQASLPANWEGETIELVNIQTIHDFLVWRLQNSPRN